MPAIRRAAFFYCVALAALGLSLHAQELTLPLKPNSVRFLAIGDMGTGQKPQYELAAKMVDITDDQASVDKVIEEVLFAE